MFKKFLVSSLFIATIFVGSFSISTNASATNISIRDFIKLLVNIGAISPNKIPAVNTFLFTLGSSADLPISSDSQVATQAIPVVVAHHSSGGSRQKLAILETSLNSSSPVSSSILVSDGLNKDEADKVVTLVFNVEASGSEDVNITNIIATTTGTAVDSGDIVMAYLFEGSTELSSSTLSASGTSVFNNLSIDVPTNTTKSLIVKVDIRNASTTAQTFSTSVDGGSSGITAKNSSNLVVNQSGLASGNVLSENKVAAIYTLIGTPTLTKTAIGLTASSSYLASFTFDIAASGVDVSVASTSAFVVGVYTNTGTLLASTTAVYSMPVSGVTQVGNGPYIIADGSSATFNPHMSFIAPQGVYTAGTIVSVRVMSATTNLGTVTDISNTFRTGFQSL